MRSAVGCPLFVYIRRPLIEFGLELRCEHAEAQAFDGPAPETINGRLAMLGVVTCLGAEFSTNVGIQEQIAKAPFSILGTFVIISLASYIPIFRYPSRSAFVMPFAHLRSLLSKTSVLHFDCMCIVTVDVQSGDIILLYLGSAMFQVCLYEH